MLSDLQNADTSIRTRVACYSRVSTQKEEQMQSLYKQIEYFKDLAKQKNYDLVEIYSDRGISGRQMKNRDELNRMIRDAELKKFDVVLVKDVSRLARNTEDFIHTIRKIKGYGIDVYFVTHNLRVQEGSEFYLTMLAAMAQEESAKLSERVKFGKNVTAKQGRVPSFVFGYDRIDRFTLIPNTQEVEAVKQIFNLLINENYGTRKIAQWLHDNNIVTKKNKNTIWYERTVNDILRNQVYTGKIINKKQEIVDFISGKRKDLPLDQQIIIERPELRIISDEDHKQALKILDSRKDSFNIDRTRPHYKYPFSTLIKCSECGCSFRRYVRTYTPHGKTYIHWICSYRNALGVHKCSNKTKISEEDMYNEIKNYFIKLNGNSNIVKKIVTKKIQSIIEEKNSHITKNKKSIEKELSALKKKKEKYMNMYTNNIITIDELKAYTISLNVDMQQIEISLTSMQSSDIITEKIEKIVDKYFLNMRQLMDDINFTNEGLKKVISEIICYPDGKIIINLKLSNIYDIKTNIPLDTVKDNIAISDVKNSSVDLYPHAPTLVKRMVFEYNITLVN